MACRVARVAVLSAGWWGTTLAKVFADAGSDVTIHARRPEVVAEIDVRHLSARYLPEVVLPHRLRATADPVEALAGARHVVLSSVGCFSPALADRQAQFAGEERSGPTRTPSFSTPRRLVCEAQPPVDVLVQQRRPGRRRGYGRGGRLRTDAPGPVGPAYLRLNFRSRQRHHGRPARSSGRRTLVGQLCRRRHRLWDRPCDTPGGSGSSAGASARRSWSHLTT
ncbi:hypothetical protein [Streptomyces mirabilis]|uniref:hypothetical protein n=1 Tax=Streptomyces mirabilis TaxID=68239 RepID=UPI0036EEDE25